MDDEDYGRRRAAQMSNHQPTRPVDKDKNEAELGISIKKAVTAEETAPSESRTFSFDHRDLKQSAEDPSRLWLLEQKHVRSKPSSSHIHHMIPD